MARKGISFLLGMATAARRGRNPIQRESCCAKDITRKTQGDPPVMQALGKLAQSRPSPPVNLFQFQDSTLEATNEFPPTATSLPYTYVTLITSTLHSLSSVQCASSTTCNNRPMPSLTMFFRCPHATKQDVSMLERVFSLILQSYQTCSHQVSVMVAFVFFFQCTSLNIYLKVEGKMVKNKPSSDKAK